jgi:hypothetical protein
VVAVQKVLRAISRELTQLLGIQPQTPEMLMRVEELDIHVQTYQVSINVVFNYNKSSIMVFIVYSFISVIN